MGRELLEASEARYTELMDQVLEGGDLAPPHVSVAAHVEQLLDGMQMSLQVGSSGALTWRIRASSCSAILVETRIKA